MAQQYYIKATMKGGLSLSGDPVITYKKGMVIHPHPDRRSKSACGEGIGAEG